MTAWPRRFVYGLLFCLPVVFLGLRYQRGEEAAFLPGRTSDGHHQIESQCSLCHDPFGGAKDEACLECHGPSLKARQDTHAPEKFEDPARSAQVALVDARSCVPCHREHRAEARLRGSVTVPTTFCIDCHSEIRQDSPSHAEFSDSGCASAGCHNYHDNRALYRNFLAKDRGSPRLRADPRVPTRTSAFEPRPTPEPDLPLPFGPDRKSRDGDQGPGWKGDLLTAIMEWSRSAHAREGVNCTGCHQRPSGPSGSAPGAVWTWAVEDTTCASCHRDERLGFRNGKHGMRLTAGLAPMSPGLARAPMKKEGSSRTLGCTSCHGVHQFDRALAAVSACEGCHNDEHTRSYRASGHFTAWLRELRQEAPPGSGVSCATCHLPRFAVPEEHARAGRSAGQSSQHKGIRVEHNQNGNLRPNDRMWREVCTHCHGASFSLAALVDAGLVAGNFHGQPSPALTSMDLVEKEERNEKPRQP
jgi:hypothetical protein